MDEPDFLQPKLTDMERSLLRTRAVNRLRWCSQLSYCEVPDSTDSPGFYPAAAYSRLAHSVMCLGWTETWLDLVEYRKKEFDDGYKAGEDLEIDEGAQATLRAAALLHDIGHTAYSHALEHDTPYKHGERTRRLVLGGEVADALKAGGLKPGKVADLIDGKGVLGPIISGDVDADKIAYVIWDSRVSGIDVPFRTYREDTTGATYLLNSVVPVDGRLVIKIHGERGDPWYSDAVNAACNLAESRSRLVQHLYGGSANSKAVTLMRNAVQIGIEAGTIEPERLFLFTDSDLLAFLKYRSFSEPVPKYLEKIETGRLPHTAVAVSVPAEVAAELKKIREDRNKRLAFEERTGCMLDINPLPGPPKGDFLVWHASWKKPITLSEASETIGARRLIRNVKAEHDEIVTRRLVAYAFKEPEKAGRKVCRELGMETPKNLVSLPGFAWAWDVD